MRLAGYDENGVKAVVFPLPHTHVTPQSSGYLTRGCLFDIVSLQHLRHINHIYAFCRIFSLQASAHLSASENMLKAAAFHQVSPPPKLAQLCLEPSGVAASHRKNLTNGFETPSQAERARCC